MKRILILLASLLVVGNVYADFPVTTGAGWETFDLVDYETGCKTSGCALVSDGDGLWFFVVSTRNLSDITDEISNKALYQCKVQSSRPSTCQIIDQNLESDFIKGGDEPINTLFPAAPSPSAPTLKERLLDLRSLVDEGLITEEDYNQLKDQLLDNS